MADRQQRRASDGPALAARHAEAIGSSFPPLIIAAERVASTVLQGVHGRRRAGQGDAFWQFRPFVQGDGASLVDWRQSAKSDRLFVRETEWEAAQTVILWRNTGPNMAFPAGGKAVTKRERADLLLLAVAALLLRGGERVRLAGTGASGGQTFFGRGALERLAAVMAQSEQAETLPHQDVTLPRYARAVLFGDFWAPLDEINQNVQALASQMIAGHLVQVVSPEEENLIGTGHVLFTDMAGAGAVPVARVEDARRAWPEIIARHRAGLAGIAAGAGWGLITHRTDRQPESALLALWQALAPPAP